MTDSTLSLNTEHHVREEAADWFVRVHDEDAPLEAFQGWQQWLAESPSHRNAYREVEETWHAFERVARPPWPMRLEAQSRAETHEDVTDAPHWRRLTRWSGAGAGLLVAAIGIGMLVAHVLSEGRTFARSEVLQTADGENREFVLPDGSRVAVGAASLLRTEFNASTRAVTVDHGEAFFEVAHERRPFIVSAGAGTITALGTAFNVNYVKGRVVVTVAEGRVEVAELQGESAPVVGTAERPQGRETPRAPVVRIAAGEQATYGLEPIAVQSANVELAKSWQAGQLRYIAEPLKFVLPGVSRYTGTQLVVADESVGRLRYTGTVLPNDVDHWLESLAEVLPVEVVRLDPDTVLLRSASHADPP